MQELNSDKIDVWCVRYEEIVDQGLLQSYRELLSESELAQERRFYFDRHKHRFLVTRALVRDVLSRYAPIAPRAWVFAKNSYGKPSIANESTAENRLSEKQISFNISHTDGLIVLAITQGAALGIDTENSATRKAALDAAQHHFAPSESAALFALPAVEQHDRFFLYWTLKEAYIKARGMGLSIPLSDFNFDFPQADSIVLNAKSKLDAAPENWRFWHYRLFGDFPFSLCAERLAGQKQSIAFRRLVPFGEEQAFEPLACFASSN